jgi:hypothetical protein
LHLNYSMKGLSIFLLLHAERHERYNV